MTAIRALLITGEHIHDWKRSAPAFKEILEESGKFNVDITASPDEVLQDEKQLNAYGVLVLDYHGSEWSEQSKINFERAISGGMGLVVIHGSNNSFRDWKEYLSIIGFHWEFGVSAHGDFHSFTVEATDIEHPIVAGLTPFETMDEIYHKIAVAPGVQYKVLATAFSSLEKKGTGKHEPMLIVKQHGLGRVFHTMLGHVWPGDPNGEYKGASMIALQSEGFRKTLVRGSEWAATGQVS